jgi:Undecaprenyl-phosphate glucose phosphotransferase
MDGSQQTATLETLAVRLRPRVRLLPSHLILLLASYDFAIVTGLSLVAALFHQGLVVVDTRHLELYLAVSLAFGSAFAILAAVDEQYSLARLQTARASALRALRSFHILFGVGVCVLFLTHITDIYSRGSFVLQYLAVSTGVVLARAVMVRAVRQAIQSGRLEAQRIALIGSAQPTEHMVARLRASGRGVGVVASFPLPAWALGELDENKSLELRRLANGIAASLRGSAVDEIVLLLPWNAITAINILMEELAALPADLGLLPEENPFGPRAPKLSRVGDSVILGLQRAPFSPVDQIAKRAFDLAVAGGILILAAPLLVMIAALIKLNSPGPILFRQQRHGFNRDPFRITKFRTMTCMEDGDVIPQACANDPRLTSVGRVLRSSNLDELPQLFDVVRGKMSLVGPRPHALAHDRAYESKIPSYSRRHNVKPGLTGWAQVNGFRGQTEEDWKMAKRVEHDLYYIDNWSLLFDIQIILMTVFSRNAFKNAQ